MPELAVRIDPLLAYNVWRSMHKRCSDPKTNGYQRYGGKGVAVDPSWYTYEQFISDMGPRPTPKHQLDRIDNNLGYNRNNCRWVTAADNIRNSSVSKPLTWNGETHPLSVWAKRLGLSPSTFKQRLRNWPLDKAMTTKPGPTGPKRTNV